MKKNMEQILKEVGEIAAEQLFLEQDDLPEHDFSENYRNQKKVLIQHSKEESLQKN